jgi:6-pyruvoyl-tetrahydropterin synthase related domain
MKPMNLEVRSADTVSTSEDPLRWFRTFAVKIRPHCARYPLSDSVAVLAVVAAGLLVIAPMTISGFPKGADLANHFRFALPLAEAIQSGHFYPGWLAETNAGYGDARFRFYPPGLYYLLFTTRIFTGSWYFGSIFAFVILSILGGLGVYFWCRSFMEPKLALWAGVFYCIVPYRVNELYQASLLAEYAACSVLPFAFAFLDRICREHRWRDVGGLALSFALLVLLNLPVAIIASISLAIYFLLRLNRKKIASTLARVCVAVLLGLAASAFFWTTMLTELPWIKGGTTEPNIYFDYRFNFVFSPRALTNINTWYANALAAAVIGFAAPAILLFLRRKQIRIDRSLTAITILLLATIFMAVELSRPVWAIVPKLSEVQFPWRWLSVTSACASVMLAASLGVWPTELTRRLRAWHFVPMLGLALSLLFVGIHVVHDAQYISRREFNEMLTSIRGALSVKEFLPIGASDVVHLQRMNHDVEAGERSVTVLSWNPESREFHVAPGAPREARIRTYYYPRWVAIAEGHLLPMRPAPDGAIVISLPAEAVTIDLKFQEPTQVSIAAAVSLVAWFIIAALFLFYFQKRHTLR